MLVPGWMGFPESMNLLAEVFRLDGRPTYVLNQNKPFIFDFLGFPTTDTATNGPRLAALVDQALADTGAERVALVATATAAWSPATTSRTWAARRPSGSTSASAYPSVASRPPAACRTTRPATCARARPSSSRSTAATTRRDRSTTATSGATTDGAATVAVDGSVCVRHVAGVAHLLEPFSLAVAAEARARIAGEPCPPADQFVGQVPDAQGP